MDQPPLQPVPKMHHMLVAPTAPATPPPAVPAPVAPAAEKTPAVSPVDAVLAKKVLTPEEALVKPEDLKPWSGVGDVVALVKPADIDKMIATINADPGSVTPTGFLFLAKALSDAKRMEEAAFYFYLGQLRVTFDIARWPPRLDPADVARLKADQSKSADQQGQTAGASLPRIKNPHESVFILSSAISQPISSWLFEDPARGDAVLAKVKAWDERVKYEYKPDYQLPEPIPFAEWAKLLPATRDGFFLRMNEFIVGLKRLKPPKP